VETIQQRMAEGLSPVTIWREDPGLAGAASKFWGGRRNALIAAGFEPPSRVWSRATVIEELRRVYPSLKQGLSVAHPRLANAATQHFGSCRNAVAAAGLEIRPRKWSRERLIHAIQDRYVRGLPLTCLGANVDIMLVSAAKLHFGRWRTALKAAGVPCPPPRRRWGRERVLAAVRAHYRDDGIPVRIRRPNSRLQWAVEHYFGHWHAALLAAGFSLPPSRKTWTRESLIAELRARRAQGSAVTWDKNRDIAYAARKLFGSWTAVLKAANMPVHRIRWNGRVLILAHVKELLEQAADKLHTVCPEVNFGVYSAGLKRRDTEHPVIVAGIQSVYKRACELDAFDLIIVDECFVEGTRVATPSGEVSIEQVLPGMYVRTGLGIGQVAAVSARSVTELVTLEYSDGTSVTCTANHPIFTESGWRQAGSLELGSLAFGIESLRVLRQNVSAMVQEPGRWQPANSTREALDQAAVLFSLLLEDPQQLHATAGCSREAQLHDEGPRTRSAHPWRQRPDGQASGDAAGATRRGMDHGTCSLRSKPQDVLAAQSSQDRYRQSSSDDCDRSGWSLSSLAETSLAGFAQDSLPGTKRLVGVSHHQSTGGRVVYNLHVLGHPSYFANGILAHNCHLIPRDGEGMYQQFLADARVINPRVRTIGLTATPFRLKSGLICGPENILNAVCYEVGVRELIRDGYLCPLVTKAGVRKADIEALHLRGGEFVAEEVERLMDQDELVESACREIIEYTRDRRAVLIFASGIAHAEHIQRVFEKKYRLECGFVCGQTSTEKRNELLARFRGGPAGRLFDPEPLKYLVNVNVLTTGFDAPNIDCVAVLRPTMSPGLWYQMVGRGFRLHPNKQNCLVLDFGGNALRHGPVDQIRVHDPDDTAGGGEAPSKECEQCHAVVAAGCTECPECGHPFPVRERANHDATASTESVVSGEVTHETFAVRDVYYAVHKKRGADDNAPRTLRVDYRISMNRWQSEWVCVEHDGYARWKAEQWWRARSNDLFPDSAEHAADVANAGGLASTNTITVRRVAGEPYERIVEYELGPKPDGVETVISSLDESDIPF
jgi:DNA repair protein RadD